MNMLQRNPRDPKHREFHDGEYEYWPAMTSRSSGSTSFPAACLIAALAATALLAAALTMLYSLTSPQAIYEDSAIVNVNIYNNVENLDIRYALSLTSDPDTVLHEGALEHSEHTLNLQGLTPGTQYVLQYASLKDGEWKPIGDFQFTTSGDPPEQTEPPLTTPTEPASVPAEAATEATESATEATEATMETEETTEQMKPPVFWRPQRPKPAEPTPEPAPEPIPEPPTPKPTPKPIALEPEIGEVLYRSQGSGTGAKVSYSFPQTFRFQNISKDKIEKVVIIRDDKSITEYTTSIIGNILSVTFNGNTNALGDQNYWIDLEKTSTTTVTVFLKDGTYVEATKDIVIPRMTNVTLAVTTLDENLGVTTYRFTITVNTNESDYKLDFDTNLWLIVDSHPVNKPIVLNWEGPVNQVYTGTINNINIPSDETIDYVEVAAIWDGAKFYNGTGAYQTIIAGPNYIVP